VTLGIAGFCTLVGFLSAACNGSAPTDESPVTASAPGAV
jgi:hypothetical protein